MAQRHLLIIDGESHRSPDLLRALEDAGWDVSWTSMLHVQLDFVPERATDAVAIGSPVYIQGREALEDLHRRYPGVPLFGAVPPEEASLRELLQDVLPRDAKAWPEILGTAPVPKADLQSALTADRQLTAEDIFGDIIADLGGEPAVTVPVVPEPLPEPPAPVIPVVEVPAAVIPPPAQPPVLATPPLPVVMEEAAAPSVPPAATATHVQTRPVPRLARPEPPEAALVTPAIPPVVRMEPMTAGVRDELEQILGLEARPVTDTAAAAPGKTDFTLSGISGINDPFQVPSLEGERTAVAPERVEAPSSKLLDSLQMPILEEFGNYYLLEKIAVGGMAELFRARQRGVHDFQKIVAIKRILPHLSDNDEFVRMFIDEAKLAAQLTHPNIAQIFDLGKVGPFYYIAMEFVDGRDLRSMLRKVREYKFPMPEAVAAFITMKVAGALEYAHRKRGMDDKDLKLVHRDISPQNILISNDGAVKLVDFGIAKAATKSTQTVAGALKGKLLYMSPEQALGNTLDHRSDIYSLGLVLFELLTGERCFQADSELGVLEKVRLGKVGDVKALNPTVSDAMATILRRALEKDVARRYGSARMMERALKELLTRHRNEPSEHDVAEFAHTLLKGTRDEVVAMAAARFPAPVLPPAPEPVSPPVLEPTPQGTPILPPDSFGAAPEPMDTTSSRQRWVLPLALVALAAAGIAIWMVLRHSGL